MNRPSRELRESVATMLKKGRFLAPPLANRMTTIRKIPRSNRVPQSFSPGQIPGQADTRHTHRGASVLSQARGEKPAIVAAAQRAGQTKLRRQFRDGSRPARSV